MNPFPIAFPKATEVVLIVLAVAAVAAADVLLKQATAHGTMRLALRSPWLLGAIGLYLFQIVFLLIAFNAGWKLSMVGALQAALYALIVLAAGILLYEESLTRQQAIGAVLAFGGVLMINWP